MSGRSFQLTAGSDARGRRLDQFLTERLAGGESLSRAQVQELIRDGHVRLNGVPAKTSQRLTSGDTLTVVVPGVAPSVLAPEPIPFPILFEDHDLLVLVKPPGVVVHPACGHATGTLVHGLLFHCGELSVGGETRPGLVHRLDKDTSGVMVVAKTDLALRHLVTQFKTKKVDKHYLALLARTPATDHGTVSTLIGRHPVHRKKMAVVTRNGRSAVTHWRVVERFPAGHCLAELTIETGRTHQIRVHMAHLGCPVAGDPVYGGRGRQAEKYGITRQCLHAWRLAFDHPVSGERMEFSAPPWDDLREVIEILRGATP